MLSWRDLVEGATVYARIDGQWIEGLVMVRPRKNAKHVEVWLYPDVDGIKATTRLTIADLMPRKPALKGADAPRIH